MAIKFASLAKKVAKRIRRLASVQRATHMGCPGVNGTKMKAIAEWPREAKSVSVGSEIFFQPFDVFPVFYLLSTV